MATINAQKSADAMLSRLDYDSNKYVSFTSEGHNIHIPYEYSDNKLIEDDAYPRIAADIELLLSSLREIFGTDYILPYFEVDRYPVATIDYTDMKYQAWRDEFVTNAKDSNSYGQKYARVRAINGRDEYSLLHIKYKQEGLEIVRVTPFIHTLADSYTFDRSMEKYTLKQFLTILARIKKRIDTTIIKAGLKPTPKLRSGFISMAIEENLFRIEEIQKTTGVHMGMALHKNPKLVKLADKGYNSGLVKIFYINDYFPSYADLEQFALLPYNWLGSLLGK